MAQLHCYVPEDMAQEAQRDTANSAGWPEGYFAVFGSWGGEPLERPPQGGYEERLPLE